MGLMISLDDDTVSIDFTKNRTFRDWSELFKPEQVKAVPYFYTDNDGQQIVEEKEAFVRDLISARYRLDLLGYSFARIKKLYEMDLRTLNCNVLNSNLSFNAFSDILTKSNIHKIAVSNCEMDDGQEEYSPSDFALKCLQDNQLYAELLNNADDKNEVAFNICYFLRKMDPGIILRLLAENPYCAEVKVCWRFADLIKGDKVEKENIVHPLPSSKKIWIVTEGSSDTIVLKKTINELYPDISDFFTFIDMKENYPFTGTGNLYYFCCGLMKIGILNKVIVIFDNDTAGKEKYDKLMKAINDTSKDESRKLPDMPNLLITQLPNKTEFEHMVTNGPKGEAIEDINGTAVSIECFLDFSSLKRLPVIDWKEPVGAGNKRQGALRAKDKYTKKFRSANLFDGNYDVSKLRYLINYLIEQWCEHTTKVDPI